MRGVLGPKSGLGILGSEMVGGIVGDQVGYGQARQHRQCKERWNDTSMEQNGSRTAYVQQIIDEFLAQQWVGVMRKLAGVLKGFGRLKSQGR